MNMRDNVYGLYIVLRQLGMDGRHGYIFYWDLVKVMEEHEG